MEKLEVKTVGEYLCYVYCDEEEGVWFAGVVGRPGCITEADSWDELVEMVADAVACWDSVVYGD